MKKVMERTTAVKAALVRWRKLCRLCGECVVLRKVREEKGETKKHYMV